MEYIPKKTRPQASQEIMRTAAIGFESGFSGFSGLTRTSPVWEGRLF